MTEEPLPRADARPPISSLAPPCTKCGHSTFVHSDTASRQCLYAECGCAEAGAVVRELRPRRRPEPTTVVLPEAEEEEREIAGAVAILARKGSAIVSVTLPEAEVDEHVERLAASGWLVDVTAARR